MPGEITGDDAPGKGTVVYDMFVARDSLSTTGRSTYSTGCLTQQTEGSMWRELMLCDGYLAPTTIFLRCGLVHVPAPSLHRVRQDPALPDRTYIYPTARPLALHPARQCM